MADEASETDIVQQASQYLAAQGLVALDEVSAALSAALDVVATIVARFANLAPGTDVRGLREIKDAQAGLQTRLNSIMAAKAVIDQSSVPEGVVLGPGGLPLPPMPLPLPGAST